MNQREQFHAVRYATEATHIHALETCRVQYPHLFGDAVIQTRPAHSRDYYIPPALADRCLVLERVAFGETGCKRLGCFPFQENVQLCEKKNEPRWIQLGQTFTLACQPACHEYPNPIDTEWSNGECLLSNSLKKVLAIMPEKMFERASRHKFHGGLDIANGHLKLNAVYCQAYGLDFDNGDCYASTAQTIGEYILGMTVIRQIKTSTIAQDSWKLNPPPLPEYLNYTSTRRIKRSTDDAPPVLLDADFYKNLATDISVDLGIDVTVSTVKEILRKKVPKVVNLAVQNIGMKIAMKQAVISSLKQLSTQTFSTLGSLMGVAGNVFAVYSLISTVIDVVDPFDYRYVLSKDQLDKIDRVLDTTFYQGSEIRPVVTPLALLDLLKREEDESERYEYMAERINEYLEALRATPRNAEAMAKWTGFVKKETAWVPPLRSMPYALIFVLVCLVILYREWIHVWAMVCFWIFMAMG